jgi:hypothetical protein
MAHRLVVDPQRQAAPDQALSPLPGWLAHAYSDAKLAKKNLYFGCVLVSRGGSLVCGFDVSVSHQAIKRLLFWLHQGFRPIS